MTSYYEPDTLHDLLLHSEREYSPLPYLFTWVDGTYESASFGQFISDVRRATDWFIEQGYKDKRIMLYGKNSYEWMVSYVAIASYVGICICANKDWKQYDLDRAVEAAQPNVIVSDASLQDYTNTVNGVQTVTFEDVPKSVDSIANDLRFDGLARGKDEDAVNIFTTGTTSFPKVVPLTLRNMFSNGRALYDRSTSSKEDRMYLFLPMHHIYSQVCVSMAALLVGAQLYLAHDVRNLLEELRQSRPTMLSGVPLFFERVLGSIEPSDMRKIQLAINVLHMFGASQKTRQKVFKKVHDVFGGEVRVFTSGGAALRYETKKMLRDLGFCVLEGYGMSEASGVVSAESMSDRLSRSVGKVLDNIDAKVVNPKADGYGELVVRGNNVMDGYWKAEGLDTSSFDEQGYYKTGDEAYLDKNGYLYIRGRIGKSLVLSSGENVSIDEMVGLVTATTSIDKVYLSESEGYLKATVFSREPRSDIEAAITHLNKELPRYKQIMTWELVNDYAPSEMK